MSQITVSHLTFAYPGSYDDIFSDASFTLDTDWKLGFCGRNGRGKTTFLQLLLGKYEYGGEIRASVDFEYFPYAVPDASEDTLSVLTQIAPDAPEWQLRRELGKLAVSEDVLYRPFETLSNGERTKALLAALFQRENAFLLIDEPTNHLDMASRELVARYLNGKSGFILVSHDRAFLDACVDHILSINRANIEIQSGNFSSWYHNKELQDSFELEKNAELKKDIKRLAETAREKAEWSDKAEATKIGSHSADRGHVGHLAAKQMKRSKSIENRRERELDEKSKLMKNLELADSLKLSPLTYHSNRLLWLENVSISYGDKLACENVTFEVNRGERVALRGRNGSGKSSILKLICGEELAHTGEAHIGSGLVISYVPQDASFLTGSLEDFAETRGIDFTLLLSILRKLDFKRVQFEKDMGDYSAGQKKKVLLAGSLCERAHLYVWDEPLNYIDVLSRMQIEELIAEYSPTLLFVEHDSAFCDAVASKVIEL
ncbi:MAG: ABC-F type ribosomal protection protein [Oscillospiraceae bacterium]|jgi:lincosamide and streptogramin A transport system ATP-binding/permease protein|nr:ABC-F type ribosomal protection protein [Oscillospiraceae bacterium]